MAFKKGQSGNPKGKPQGTLNKATRDIKALAEPYGPEALETLVRLMREADSDQVKKAAAAEILDRAYGKPTQTVEGNLSHNYVAYMPAPCNTAEEWAQKYAPQTVQ